MIFFFVHFCLCVFFSFIFLFVSFFIEAFCVNYFANWTRMNSKMDINSKNWQTQYSKIQMQTICPRIDVPEMTKKKIINKINTNQNGRCATHQMRPMMQEKKNRIKQVKFNVQPKSNIWMNFRPIKFSSAYLLWLGVWFFIQFKISILLMRCA